MKPTAHLGDCVEVLASMEPETFDSVVCDPPYHLTSMAKRLSRTSAGDVEKNFSKTIEGQGKNPYKAMAAGFMGKQWDGGDVAFRPETWTAIARVMKPGACLVAFGGTRTSHRMACAIEDAGLEIRDSLLWLYGTGFPKSLDVSKAIDKAAGAEREVVGVAGKSGSARSCMAGDFAGGEYMATAPATESARQWQGWGTALKPAHEPIILARKPLAEKTVAANVLAHGVGALNIDKCRVPGAKPDTTRGAGGQHGCYSPIAGQGRIVDDGAGRWPSNVLHDGSPEVLEAFARFGVSKSTDRERRNGDFKSVAKGKEYAHSTFGHTDTGTAARFFPELGFHYSGKATKLDRAGSKHPTVKPQSLMRWLCRLVTPPGGHVLDPFAGSGSTLQAAHREGFRATGIELTPEHFEDIQRRLRLLEAFDDGLFAGMGECA